MSKYLIPLLGAFLIAVPTFAATTCYPPIPNGCTSQKDFYETGGMSQLCLQQAIEFTQRNADYNACIDLQLAGQCQDRSTAATLYTWNIKNRSCDMSCQKGAYMTVHDVCVLNVIPDAPKVQPVEILQTVPTPAPVAIPIVVPVPVAAPAVSPAKPTTPLAATIKNVTKPKAEPVATVAATSTATTTEPAAVPVPVVRPSFFQRVFAFLFGWI